jgi:hypothetical protein
MSLIGRSTPGPIKDSLYLPPSAIKSVVAPFLWSRTIETRLTEVLIIFPPLGLRWMFGMCSGEGGILISSPVGQAPCVPDTEKRS